jgi:cytochrome c556
MPLRYSQLVVLLAAVFCLLTLAADARSQEGASQAKLAAFMKAKLGHSEKLLEGLAREDYALIAKHSQAISLLCEDELWMVMMTPEYLERSNEFRRSVNAVTEAARAKNLDGAALAYVDSTMKCVTCHKYIRQAKDKR